LEEFSSATWCTLRNRRNLLSAISMDAAAIKKKVTLFVILMLAGDGCLVINNVVERKK
jgi:hypothetical protein